MKEYLRQHPNTNKHSQRNKESGKMQKKGAKFNPKTWAYSYISHLYKYFYYIMYQFLFLLSYLSYSYY